MPDAGYLIKDAALLFSSIQDPVSNISYRKTRTHSRFNRFSGERVNELTESRWQTSASEM
jgi:hypothetical protein